MSEYVTIPKAVLQKGLEALKYHVEQTRPISRTDDAIAALNEALKGTEHICEWARDEEGGYWWDTTCGNSFAIDDGTPVDNRMEFCCFCSNKLIEVPYEHEGEDND